MGESDPDQPVTLTSASTPRHAGHTVYTCFVQDDFDPSPARIIIRTDDPALGIADILPASIAALLLKSTKLGKSGLEVLEFDGMDNLRLIARKITAELGSRARSPRLAVFKSMPLKGPSFRWHGGQSHMHVWLCLHGRVAVCDTTSAKYTKQMRNVWCMIQAGVHAGLQFMVQDYVTETDGGILHESAPSATYHEANNMAADMFHASTRSLTQQRVRGLLVVDMGALYWLCERTLERLIK